jgi:hypothetical protein
VLLSLRLSCRSELTRQGASLSVVATQQRAVGFQLSAVSQTFVVARTSRFRWPLHVAVQLGLYLHPSADGARRIVSEDSGVGNLHRAGRGPAFAVADPVFPADYLHLADCDCRPNRMRFGPTSTAGYSGVPAFSRVHESLVTQRWAVKKLP